MTVKNIASNIELSNAFTSKTSNRTDSLSKSDGDFLGCMNRSTKDNADFSKQSVDNTCRRQNITDKTNQGKEKNITELEYEIVDGSFVVRTNEITDSMSLMSREELIDSIRDIVCEKLGITKEELDEKMSEMGIDEICLLQNDVLQQLFISLNEIDTMMDLLTDEELSDKWNFLLDSMTELTDEISPYLDKIMMSSDAPKVITTDDNKEVSFTDTDSVNKDTSNKSVAVAEEKEASDASRSNNNSDTLMNDTDSFDEALFEKFINRMQETLTESERFDAGEVNQIRDISFQIIEGIKANVKADTSSIELMLNPESLGKVNVSIVVKDGVATAQFAVRNELAKAAIESQIQTLKTTFEQQGIKVEAIEVTVSDFSFENRQQAFEQEKEKKSGRTVIAEAKEEFEEEAEEESPDDGGINLTA